MFRTPAFAVCGGVASSRVSAGMLRGAPGGAHGGSPKGEKTVVSTLRASQWNFRVPLNDSTLA